MNRIKRVLATVLTVLLVVTMLPLAQTEVYAAKSMKLSKKKITLTVGKKKKLKVKNKPNGVKVKWKSSKKKVATVSKKGVVKAKKAGKTTITATVGNKKVKCKVTVKGKNNVPATTQAPQAPVTTQANGGSQTVTTAAPQGGGQQTTTASQGGNQQTTTAPQGGNQQTTAAPQGGNQQTTTASQGGNQQTTTASQGGNQQTTTASQGGNQQTTTAPQMGDIYANVPFLADGAKGGELNDTYKAVVISGDITVNNIQEFQGIVAIHNILADADVGNVTVNGNKSTGKVEGAGLFINIEDLTQTDNEVKIYTQGGAEKGVIRIYNAKASGGSSTRPTQSQGGNQQTTTASQGGNQQTTTASQGGNQQNTTAPQPTQPQNPTLSDVVGLVYAGNADLPHFFAWAAVEGAEGYHVFVNNNKVADVSGSSVNLDASLFQANGTYNIGVQAFAGNAVSKITTITYEVTSSGGSSGGSNQGQTTQASQGGNQQTTTAPQSSDIYANAEFIPDGARGGELSNTYKAVVMSGEITVNNVQEFQGVVAIHNILADGDIGKVTVNGNPSTGLVEGAGVFININDLTQTDNEVKIYNTSGSEKGVIRIYNAKPANGGSSQPSTTQPQQTTTQSQGGEQPTTTAPQSSDIYANAEFIPDGAKGGELNNTYKAVVMSGDIAVNNIQEFQGIVAIHNIMGDGDIGNVTVNGKQSNGRVEGAGVFININDLTQTDNEVKIYTTSGSEKGVIRIYNAKPSSGGSSQQPTTQQQGGNQQPTTQPQGGGSGDFAKDPSLAKPFGMVVGNPDSGIISVVWGAGELNCYNVYVDGVRKRTKVTAGVQNIPVQTEGMHTVSVATVNPTANTESEWVTMEVNVVGVAEPETTDYPEELKPQLNTNIPKENGKMILQLNNKTNGQYRDDQIYWIVVGRNPQTHQLAYVDRNGNLINVDMSLNNGTLASGRQYSQTIIHTLAEASYVHLPAIESGRMYLSYGEPVYITFNQDAGGNMGYAGPDVNNTGDANYNTLFEYLEFTTEAVNGSIRFHGNTTRVDFFSFPILTRLTDEYGGYDRCVGDIGTRDEIFNSFRSTVSAPFQTLVDDKRIMAPAKKTFGEGQIYANYFDDYINRFWAKYTNEDLVFACEGGEFRGRVQGNRIAFTKTGDNRTFYVDKPSTQDVLEGRGAFNRGSSGDPSQTSIELVIEAQLCAAFTRGIAMQPENYGRPSTYYKSGEIFNEYAAFFHDHSVSRRAYGFCYDDVYDQSTLVECDNAAALTIDLKW